jgi:hypothetical protein
MYQVARRAMPSRPREYQRLGSHCFQTQDRPTPSFTLRGVQPVPWPRISLYLYARVRGHPTAEINDVNVAFTHCCGFVTCLPKLSCVAIMMPFYEFTCLFTIVTRLLTPYSHVQWCCIMLVFCLCVFDDFVTCFMTLMFVFDCCKQRLMMLALVGQCDLAITVLIRRCHLSEPDDEIRSESNSARP